MTSFPSPLYSLAMSLYPTPTIFLASKSHFSPAASDSSTEPLSSRYLSPSTSHISKNTTFHDVHKVKATLYIWDPWKYSIFGRRRLGSISYWKNDSMFSVNGYWSESSGKLCRVRLRKSYVGSFSSKYPDVVLKLNYSKNNSIYGSLIGGTLECLHVKNDYNYFEPIVILGLSQNF